MEGILAIDFEQVSYTGFVGTQTSRRAPERLDCFGRSFEHLRSFTSSFTPGRVYGIIGPIHSGGWAVSWIASGLLRPKSGRVMINGVAVSPKDLRRVSAAIGGLTPRWARPFMPTVRQRLVRALNEQPAAMEDFVSRFGLTPERLDRPLSQLSNERWRASAAIAVAEGKKLLCFPWLPANYIRNYRSVWFEHLLTLLRDHEATVLVPTDEGEDLDSMFDSVEQLGVARS